MDIGELNAAYLRQTYLRGIDLGEGWQGHGGDDALDRLLRTELAALESTLGILFGRYMVKTYPDPALALGHDYEIAGDPIPYVAPLPGESVYRIALRYPQILSVERVRVVEGLTSSFVIAPVFDTIAPADIALSVLDRAVQVRASAVLAPGLAQAWAIDYTIGYGRIPADIAEWLAMGVVATVLASSGMGVAFGGPAASRTLTMDGISQTDAFRTGKYGPYAGLITWLQEQRAAAPLAQWRHRYQPVAYPTW